MYILFVFPVGLDRLLLRKTTQMPLRDDLCLDHPPEGAPTLVAQGHAHIPGFTSYPLVMTNIAIKNGHL